MANALNGMYTANYGVWNSQSKLRVSKLLPGGVSVRKGEIWNYRGKEVAIINSDHIKTDN